MNRNDRIACRSYGDEEDVLVRYVVMTMASVLCLHTTSGLRNEPERLNTQCPLTAKRQLFECNPAGTEKTILKYLSIS